MSGVHTLVHTLTSGHSRFRWTLYVFARYIEMPLTAEFGPAHCTVSL